MTTDTITGADNISAVTDRELLERVAKQLDHLDAMLHEVSQVHSELRPLLPLIPRALALLDPAAAFRRGRKGARDAV